MRIFLTGATGFIGSAIVQELLTAGHQVLGLARSDDKAQALTRLGIEAHRGNLLDTESLAAGARACDGVIHTAFIHDFANVSIAEAAEVDQRVVAAMVAALESTDKPLVIASGTAGVASERLATEEDVPVVITGRAVCEEMVRAAASRGVRGSIVRLPPTVHGAGDKGFVPMFIDIARRTGLAAFVGDGANRWAAVHRLDAARLFRLAAENAEPGARLHGVAEEGVPMREIAQTIGEGLGVPVRGIGPDEAGAHFGWMAGFVALDNPTSSVLTREALGWEPKEIGLLTDLRESGYFSF
ncbi:Nucleoside-diphosphate-sugar epimerase [Abditibacterium utsteinense]|uniref:Nucleoside-diphosphate-sugar epimerase n=1 Tax=Abditibacterium utsteinense TaxID=1960156 RepID=A0A2S8SPG4_9BACT|nr:SDR family oxidoreductase [Abditibacterium utsteinense]PQV62681.1 Nucleoside-diphosphate-sugar epimerase [Abditibacterium utsteinense]